MRTINSPVTTFVLHPFQCSRAHTLCVIKLQIYHQVSTPISSCQSGLFEVDLDHFVLIGILCGLAIYNSVIVDIPFPMALYKKLLGW